MIEQREIIKKIGVGKKHHGYFVCYPLDISLKKLLFPADYIQELIPSAKVIKRLYGDKLDLDMGVSFRGEIDGIPVSGELRFADQMLKEDKLKDSKEGMIVRANIYSEDEILETLVHDFRYRLPELIRENNK